MKKHVFLKSTNQSLLKKNSLQNSVEIDGNQIILNSMDNLSLGGDELSSDYTGKREVSIFAENIFLEKDFVAKKAIISTSNLIVAKDKIFNLSGDRGSDDIPGNPKSHDGQKGGSLFLYVEYSNKDNILTLNAKGGDGGNGKEGNNDKGGNGGNGGDGGQIVLCTNHQYLDIVKQISNIQLRDSNIQKILIKQLLGKYQPTQIPLLQDLSNLIKEDSIDPIKLKDTLQQTIVTLYTDINFWQTQQDAFIDVSGGKYGVYGAGNPSGANGEDGKNGNKSWHYFGKVQDLLSSQDFYKDQSAFLPIHPAQCIMTLNKIKLKYMFLDSSDETVFKNSVQDIVIMLNRLNDRTMAFAALKESDPISTYWKDNEKSIGAFDSIETFKKINKEVTSYLKNIKQGLGFFGYKSNYVPLVQVTDIQIVAEKLTNDFKDIENHYISYLGTLQDENDRKEQIKNLRNKIKDNMSQIESDLPILEHAIEKTANLIDGYQSVLEIKKQKVEEMLKHYLDAVKHFFDFDIKSFLEAASTIAFAPDSPAMWIAQAGKLAYSGETEITDIQGQPVRKEFIVHNIETIQADLKTISEGCKVDVDGSIKLDDPGADKLLAEQKQIEQLLNQFYGKFPSEAADLKDAIKDYVTLVIDRNNQVLSYNAYICVLQQDYQLRQSMTEKQTSINDEMVATISANTPSLAAFALEAYNLARNNVMQVMDIAARAYKLWTLKSKNLLTESTKSTIGISYKDEDMPEIDSVTLESIHSSFWYQYTLDMIDKGPNGSPFHGITYSINDPLCLKTFKDLQKVDYEILPQAKGDAGVFLGMSEIRISEVRAYINGVKTNTNEITVNITHGADDVFITSYNQKVTFNHQHITKPFHYKLSNYQDIKVHANFSISSFTKADTDTAHPVISPFTVWTIEIPTPQDVDLSGVSSIDLTFMGICNGFDS